MGARFAVNPEVKRAVGAGERFDVAILNPPVLDDLIKRGVASSARETERLVQRSGSSPRRQLHPFFGRQSNRWY
ncbi:MAG: hypothetical protein HY017_21495 [Betaproteobacteria bacterium]|nr:hypothetical protein [Betaproteobacteria bacterium]